MQVGYKSVIGGFSEVIKTLFILGLIGIGESKKAANPCGVEHLLNQHGFIQSPNYPLPYPNNISCTWTILSPPNTILTLMIKDVDIEEDEDCPQTPCCKYNWLSVPTDDGEKNKKICGRNLLLKPICITKHQTTIQFLSSNTTTERRGFYILYKKDSSSCQHGEFMCGDGKCLPGTMRCDRVAQCIDQTDEIGCQDDCIGVGKVSCGPQAVADCFDNITQRCDGVKDCSSGRDELACETIRCENKCHSAACYTHSQACDNHPHCLDFTDEMNCGHCKKAEEALCGMRTSHCFSPVTERCDGIFQCPFGEDEVGCEPGCDGGISCSNNQGCYPALARCDTQLDCLDGSDELNCPEDICIGENRLCNNAKCRHHLLWCNGIDDCGDNSDEENCIRNSVISITIMGCLLCGLLLILAVLCTLRAYTKRTMESSHYSFQLPPHIASRLSMSHSISLPAVMDDEFFYREPPPAYSVAVSQSSSGIASLSHSGRRLRAHHPSNRTRRHRSHPLIKPPSPLPSTETSNQSSPSRDSITSSSYLSNDDNVHLIDS